MVKNVGTVDKIVRVIVGILERYGFKSDPRDSGYLNVLHRHNGILRPLPSFGYINMPNGR